MPSGPLTEMSETPPSGFATPSSDISMPPRTFDGNPKPVVESPTVNASGPNVGHGHGRGTPSAPGPPSSRETRKREGAYSPTSVALPLPTSRSKLRSRSANAAMAPRIASSGFGLAGSAIPMPSAYTLTCFWRPSALTVKTAVGASATCMLSYFVRAIPRPPAPRASARSAWTCASVIRATRRAGKRRGSPGFISGNGSDAGR